MSRDRGRGGSDTVLHNIVSCFLPVAGRRLAIRAVTDANLNFSNLQVGRARNRCSRWRHRLSGVLQPPKVETVQQKTGQKAACPMREISPEQAERDDIKNAERDLHNGMRLTVVDRTMQRGPGD